MLNCTGSPSYLKYRMMQQSEQAMRSVAPCNAALYRLCRIAQHAQKLQRNFHRHQLPPMLPKILHQTHHKAIKGQ